MSKTVLLIGGGAFGTSTAYHLSQRKDWSVTVLDRFDAPSTDSAATDLNKVIRFDYPNPLYSKSGQEAMADWSSANHMFAGLFRKTGWVMSGHDLTVEWLKRAYAQAQKEKKAGVQYMSAENMRERWPAFTGEFPGWTNLYSSNAGWVSKLGVTPNNSVLMNDL